jgi:hypothetical protein
MASDPKCTTCRRLIGTRCCGRFFDGLPVGSQVCQLRFFWLRFVRLFCYRGRFGRPRIDWLGGRIGGIR